MSEQDIWEQLGEEVAQGNLRLKIEPDALDRAIKGLQDLIDEIDDLGYAVRTVETVTGFGGFTMGVQLAEKFTRKGSGEDSIKQRMKEVQGELQAAQDLLRKAAAAYAEAEDANTDRFR
ncbi:hypothetical protein IRT45_16015 [Nocardia sp. BSTN01]|uniref:hypothetical protein n=1 Tax=Nocardia sp. BSTN01 TaxID=2783665 RepID=UPI00188FC6E3|nr:hypothetical protein [Nocardia sp. BSTN01]MBF4998656.1 hypothetical protein [Nocardia sp. BSTN01]